MTGHRRWHRFLLPLEPVYRGAVMVRRAAYRRGWLRSSRLTVPVVSVGNLTFGGTGKTPTVIALVRDLVRRGRRPAVLTRGYGRTTDRQIVLVGPDAATPVSMVGDEPLELAARLPGIPVVVDADRVRGGIEAIGRGADTLVLDDGFQHLKLERDLDLVLFDAGDPWGGGRLPPGGRLREPVAHIARADAVLVTKLPADAAPALDAIRRELRRFLPDAPVLGARLEPTVVRLPDGPASPDVLRHRRVLAVAGLGRPEGFAELLRGTGALVVGERWFDDHHHYTAGELAGLVSDAERLGAVVVTTAKDAVKLPGDAAVWVVEATMRPIAGSWDALWRLLPGTVP